MNHLLGRLFEPVDISSLVFCRIAFGGVMLWHVWTYFRVGAIKEDFIQPAFHFTWYWFGWVRPLSGADMYVVFFLMGMAALGILLGLLYRVSALLFFLLFTYQFLLDQAYYLNHYYLTCLLGLLMVLVPAHRALSLDAWMRPRLRSQTAPRWALWIIRFQIGVPYFYGGLAKLTPDWLQCQPMTMALAQRSYRLPLISRYMTEQWMIWVFNYGSLIFDLAIIPLLIWKRTRLFAFLIAVAFHLINAKLFDIGYFPWFMLLATTIFFEPDWPRRWVNGFARRVTGRTWLRAVPDAPHEPLSWANLNTVRRGGILAVNAYVLIQVLVPLRHHCYAGPVGWTEAGHRFAWHMMLRGKICDLRYYATDPVSGQTRAVDIEEYLTERQAIKLAKDPDMIHQFALHLADELRKDGFPETEIRVLDLVSLNGRKPQLLIDPRVDLASIPRTWRHPSWLINLHEPLRSEAWQIPVKDWERHVDLAPYLEGTPLDRPAAEGDSPEATAMQ